MAAIILAVLSVFGIIFVLSPIFLSKGEEVVSQKASNADRISELNGHKNVLFALLKDLEFEYETGKLSDSDYEKLQEEYRNKVFVIYQEMDSLAAETVITPTTADNNG